MPPAIVRSARAGRDTPSDAVPPRSPVPTAGRLAGPGGGALWFWRRPRGAGRGDGGGGPRTCLALPRFLRPQRKETSMSFVEKHRYMGHAGEQALLKISWEGEVFGVGMFETMAEMYPEHADVSTPAA